MKSKNKLLFIASLKLAMKIPNKVGLIILFDVLFLVSLLVLQKLFRYFAQSFVAEITLTFGLILLIFTLIYYLITLLVYSFFKYSILEFIKSLFDKAEFSFKRLGQFYSLNIMIAGIFFAIMFLANFLLASVKAQYRPFVFIFLAVPYLMFLYIIVNTSHSSFYQGASIKDAIKKGFEITFKKIKVYRETILIMILFALLLWLVFFGSGYLVRLIASKNYNLYLNAYAYFKQASIIIFDIVFYFIILINRISFYAIVKENKY